MALAAAAAASVTDNARARLKMSGKIRAYSSVVVQQKRFGSWTKAASPCYDR